LLAPVAHCGQAISAHGNDRPHTRICPLLARAQKLLARGRADEAERLLSEAISRAAKDPRYTIVLSRIRESQWDFPGAVATMADALRLFLNHAPTHLQRGIVLSDLAMQQELTDTVRFTAIVQQARAAFERVLELQPKNDLARSYLAITLY